MNDYLNLRFAMSREGVTRKEVAEVLGTSIDTIARKLDGSAKSGFTVEEAFRLRDARFTKYDVMWLFEREKSDAGR